MDARQRTKSDCPVRRNKTHGNSETPTFKGTAEEKLTKEINRHCPRNRKKIPKSVVSQRLREESNSR